MAYDRMAKYEHKARTRKQILSKPQCTQSVHVCLHELQTRSTDSLTDWLADKMATERVSDLNFRSRLRFEHKCAHCARRHNARDLCVCPNTPKHKRDKPRRCAYEISWLRIRFGGRLRAFASVQLRANMDMEKQVRCAHSHCAYAQRVNSRASCCPSARARAHCATHSDYEREALRQKN